MRHTDLIQVDTFKVQRDAVPSAGRQEEEEAAAGGEGGGGGAAEGGAGAGLAAWEKLSPGGWPSVLEVVVRHEVMAGGGHGG